MLTCPLAADKVLCSEKDNKTHKALTILCILSNTLSWCIFMCASIAAQTYSDVGDMEREVQICTFMKLMLSDLWKNVCTELRSFSACCRLSLSCRTCWEFFLTYTVKVFSSICTVSAWFASSSACILWYWALTRSFSSDTASCGWGDTCTRTITANYFTC